MTRRLLLAWVVMATACVSARAQSPFPRDLIPTRTALARLGLERHWATPVPLVGDERVMGISQAEGLIFAQTDKGYFHTLDAETGRILWSTRLGTITARVRGASVNSFAVYVSNLNQMIALDRNTGVKMWSRELNGLPASATASDENLAMVGLMTGKVYAYHLKSTTDGKTKVADKGQEAWNWQTGKTVQTRPLLAGKFVVFGSDDGKVYVALADERTMLYRIATGGAIGAGFATHGTRTLFATSADNNVYAIDLFSASVNWTYASGAPIQQEPMVAGDDLIVVNAAGQLTSLEIKTGSPRWITSTRGGHLLAIGEKRVYLASHDGDLFIVDRNTGQTVADPPATRTRAGVNTRPFDYVITNRINDRVYMGTSSGLVLSLREAGQIAPRALRDTKEKPFGYIPPEGISLTPKPAAAEAPAEGGQAPAEGAAPPAEGAAPPPAEGSAPPTAEGTPPPPPENPQ